MDKLIELFKAEIKEIKSEQKDERTKREVLEKRVQDLETSDKLQNKEIDNINSVLSEIKDDTKFIRRTVQGAVITGILTLVIAVVWAALINS